jgi:hypothetical protein
MRIPSTPIGAYAREVSRTPARAGSLVDLTAAASPSTDATPASGAASASGNLRGVLTPEEERFIAGLFGGTEGPKEDLARVGRVYSPVGRTVPGAASGIRMDLRA